MKKRNLLLMCLAVFHILFFITTSYAQSEEDLAKVAQNPVGNLISLPLQNNTIFGFGPYDRTLRQAQ